MISPSLNTLNCWKPVRDSGTIPCGNDMATRKTSEYLAISSEASLKGEERSTTKESNLRNMVKSSRTGWFIYHNGNKQDIVWTCLKKQEDKIKSLSVTFREIKNYGDTVIVRTVPDIDIVDYYKGMKIDYPSYESPSVELQINKGKLFRFAIDSVDKRQADINYVEKWSENASKKMQEAIDSSVINSAYADVSSYNKGATAGATSSSYNLGATTAAVAVTKTNVLDYYADVNSVLTENKVPEVGRWIVIPVWMANLVQKSDIKDASMTNDQISPLRNGRIGVIYGLETYVTNQYTAVTDTHQCYHVLFGTKDGITFASQMTQVETLKNPFAMGDLIRGVNIYGFKVIKPEAIGDLYCYKG